MVMKCDLTPQRKRFWFLVWTTDSVPVPQVERLPAVRRRHAAGHFPHVHLPQEAPSSAQEEEEEEKAEPGRHVQRRRRAEGEEQQQQAADGHLVHGLREGHQRFQPAAIFLLS